MYMCGLDEFISDMTGTQVWTLNEDQRGKYFVVSLSGGKDSTAVLLKLLEHEMLVHEVVYVDTGKEMPEMAKHIGRLRDQVEAEYIQFTQLQLEKPFEYWLGKHVKTKGKHKGKKGYGWPDHMNRWCTSLKIQTLKRYYKQLTTEHETVEFIGFAADEIQRTENNKDSRIKEYPLVLWDMVEEDALKYCYSQGYDWGGLYDKFARVSCYCCPLSRLSELKYVYKNYPELWQDMKQMDVKSYRQFRSDYSLDDLELKFETEPERLSLFTA